MTIKVNKTEKYNDSQGEHIVTRGRLVCIPISVERASTFSKTIEYIIISHDEPIKEGEKCYQTVIKEIIDCPFDVKDDDRFRKLLALPEHFSPKHIQSIVDGKMKDGDEVLVECESSYEREGIFLPFPHEQESKHYITVKKMNYANHIKLFKVNKETKDYTSLEVRELIKKVNRELLGSFAIRNSEVEEWCNKNIK
jgi:hypothetical protein